MSTYLTDDRLAQIRRRANLGADLSTLDARDLVVALDETRSQLAALKAEHADSDYWRKAFERLRDDTNRETRDRFDRIASGATR